MLLTKRYNNGTYDAVSHDYSEHTQGPSIHGSIFKLICLVLYREEKCLRKILRTTFNTTLLLFIFYFYLLADFSLNERTAYYKPTEHAKW